MGLWASHLCQSFVPPHTQGCCHGPFPEPPLSFSAKLPGIWLPGPAVPLPKGLLKMWLFHQDLVWALQGWSARLLSLLALPWQLQDVPTPLPTQHSSTALAPRESALGPGWVVLGCVCCAGRGFLFPPWWQQPESVVLWRGAPALAAVPGSLAAGRVVAVFPRSAPGVIAQMGTWGNSHPSPGVVMSEEDSKTNGSLRSSAALQDFSSHQPLHQQRQHLLRSLSQPWRRSCQAAGAGAKINHVLNNVPSPSNGLSSASWCVEQEEDRTGALGHRGFGFGAWEAPMLGDKRCVRAGDAPSLGVPEPPVILGCQKPPALWRSQPAVLPSVAFSVALVNTSCSTHIYSSSACVHLS